MGHGGRLIFVSFLAYFAKHARWLGRISVREAVMTMKARHQYEARANVLVSEEAREKARQLFLAKYRLQFRFFDMMGRNSSKAILEIEKS